MNYGIVRAVYVLAGYPVCDIVDERNGALYTGCRFLSTGGGSADSVSYDPPSKGSRVLYGVLRGSAQALILGIVFATRAQGRIVEDPEEVGYMDDYPPQVGVGDKYYERGGSWMFLTDDGQFVFDSSQSYHPIRCQLSATISGHLRISQEGNAEDWLLLATPTKAYLDQLRSDLDDTRAKLAKVMGALDALTTPKPPAYAADIADLTVPGLSTDSNMLASAVRISSRSVLDDEV